MEQVHVALLGLGTVGTGVYKMISTNQDVIARQTGRYFEIQSILVRNLDKERNLKGIHHLLTDQFAHVLDKQVDVVVEAMGGVEPALTYVKQAIEHGCHVVTANKELVARHGVELEKLAAEKGVQLLYEASVGGGIPILGTLQHFLKVNRIHKVMGIVNGTTNFILTQMDEGGRDFDDVLAEAQQKGYAEADPTADVEGIDAAHKTAILSRIVFGVAVNVDEIPRRGISDVKRVELQLANMLGYKFKLLAQAEQFGENGPVSCSVMPTLVPHEHPLAGVSGVYNAITAEADQAQDITLVGQGAGEKPTASAVVEDVTNLYRLPLVHRPILQPSLFVPHRNETGLSFVLLHSPHQAKDHEVEQCIESLEKSAAHVVDDVLIYDKQGTYLGMLLNQHNDAWQSSVSERWRVEQIRPVLAYGEVVSKSKSLQTTKS
ncbi:homoserine dehydrogenase [Seinonella peptonophila]|uniref:Homoserine dehydrogenase n=1 Tax=Seinonella peptonophila TaxID=112248 RepID=A0A1M4VQL3_9BACL|nr:homoserine dehydrogenase [Seinonella peptonophila]SHE71123.1 homoserine dehydrogenase [Seinonella peptonophila]